jgi:hypothetical protein
VFLWFGRPTTMPRMRSRYNYPITKLIIRDVEKDFAPIGVSFDEAMFGTNRLSQNLPEVYGVSDDELSRATA